MLLISIHMHCLGVAMRPWLRHVNPANEIHDDPPNPLIIWGGKPISTDYSDHIAYICSKQKSLTQSVNILIYSYAFIRPFLLPFYSLPQHTHRLILCCEVRGTTSKLGCSLWSSLLRNITIYRQMYWPAIIFGKAKRHWPCRYCAVPANNNNRIIPKVHLADNPHRQVNAWSLASSLGFWTAWETTGELPETVYISINGVPIVSSSVQNQFETRAIVKFIFKKRIPNKFLISRLTSLGYKRQVIGLYSYEIFM